MIAQTDKRTERSIGGENFLEVGEGAGFGSGRGKVGGVSGSQTSGESDPNQLLEGGETQGIEHFLFGLFVRTEVARKKREVVQGGGMGRSSAWAFWRSGGGFLSGEGHFSKVGEVKRLASGGGKLVKWEWE